MRFQSLEDRHRLVINQRLKDILATNILQSHGNHFAQFKSLIDQIDNGIDFTALFAMPEYAECKPDTHKESQELFSLLKNNESWRVWQSLTDDSNPAVIYSTHFK